jgi:ABC-type transport system involved in multi-copper enzyme maturation permease subunit
MEGQSMSGMRFSTQAGFVAGQRLYRALFMTQAVLIALITPAITAGSITLEREQRTFEMVALTRLRPSEVILGKLAAAVAFVALLLTSSLPLVSLAFFLGGVSPGEVFFTYLTLLFASLLFGALGLYCSSLVPTTAAATVLAFGSVGTYSLTSFATVPFSMSGPGAPQLPFRSLNPIGAVMSATSGETFFRGSVPSWLPAVLLLGLAALLAANLAMARLPFYRDARSAPIRLCATALWGFAFLHMIAHTLGLPGFQAANVKEVRTTLVTLAGIDLALLLLLLPPLATGPLDGVSVREHLRALLPHRALGDRLASGAPVLVAWLLLPFLFLFGGVALMRPAHMGVTLAILLPTALLALAMTAAFIGLGHFLSAWLPSRGPAMGLTYTATAAACLLPYVTLIQWHDPLEPRPDARLAWNLLYLTPFTALAELADRSGFRTTMPPTLAGDIPYWLVTTVIYAFLAACLAAATLARLARRKIDVFATDQYR